jgi:hypothetical protein
MEEEWREHPPVHHLVAAHLDYKPAAPPEDDTPDDDLSGPAPSRPEWIAGMGRNLQAPEGMATAASPEEALASLERMFFGEVHEL